MPLKRYREKRRPERTPEPFGGHRSLEPAGGAGMFVIQKHAARRLHYDFRLEMEGVLRSWAVPKGPSLDPRDKRLAVMVEDHPLEYGDFEGVIAPGNYGAGCVIVWDRGQYRIIDPLGATPADAVRAGKLDFELTGFKLGGVWTLVRMRWSPKGAEAEKDQWLLIKKRDRWASEDDLLKSHPRSVLSGFTVEEMRDAPAAAEQIAAELERLGAKPMAPAPVVSLGPNAFPLSLAKLVEKPVEGDKWLFEIKYDGVRALAIRERGHTRLYGRSGAEITRRYPELALAFDALPLGRFVLDGEIVALDDDGRPSFQQLQRRMHAEGREAGRLSRAIPVHYFAFDLLALGDFDLRGLALEVRKKMLARLIRGEGRLRYCDHYLGRGKDFFEAAAKAGLEGIVAKRRDSPYRGRRSEDWLKIKCPLTRRFVIGGYTDARGTRLYFGALLLGLYEPGGALRFVSKVGTGFDDATLRDLHRQMNQRARSDCPFRRPAGGEVALARKAHFCDPELVCEVRFSEVTDNGGLRHPSFLALVKDADPAQCRADAPLDRPREPATAAARPSAAADPPAPPGRAPGPKRNLAVTNPGKLFWPREGYTKADLVEYYRGIAKWMLPYLEDRPVMIVRYPDGIEGKSFYQKDAPGFAPQWIRTEKIYSKDSGREIAHFVLESAPALGYVANLGTIPIHIWSSRISHLGRPDWLLFDIDPKGSTTACAAAVAGEVGAVLRAIGLRPVLKTSGQMGLHVVVGLKPLYTYEQARAFAELVARLVVSRIPDQATLSRGTRSRQGRVYIDYLQLGYGKTIAAPFAVRPLPGAPVSAPLEFEELCATLDPAAFNIKTVPARMERLGRDPFRGAIDDRQTIEDALAELERQLHAAAL